MQCFRYRSVHHSVFFINVQLQKEIYLLSEKDRTKKKLLGFSFLTLSADNATTVYDGLHELHLHKVRAFLHFILPIDSSVTCKLNNRVLSSKVYLIFAVTDKMCHFSFNHGLGNTVTPRDFSLL